MSLLKTKQAAAFLGASVAQVKRWASEGRLPYYKPGGELGSLYFKQEDLEAYRDASYVPATQGPLAAEAQS